MTESLDTLWDEMYRAIRENRDGQRMIALRQRIEAEAARRAPGDRLTAVLDRHISNVRSKYHEYPHLAECLVCHTSWVRYEVPAGPRDLPKTETHLPDCIVGELRALAADSRPEQPR